MAEFDDPRRKRPRDEPESDGGDDVYELEGDDPADDAPAEAGDRDPAELVDDLDDAPVSTGTSRPSAPAPAPLPRIWKVAPESDAQGSRPARPADTSSKPADKPPAQPSKPASPAPRLGGPRRDSGPIERVGQVKPPSEKASAPRSKPAPRDERSGRSSKPHAASSADSDAEPKALIEATPSLDTYEARQAARIIVGLVMLGICVLMGFGVTWYFTARPPADETSLKDAVAQQQQQQPAQPDTQALDAEARALFDRAREAARKKDAKLAMSLLERVVKSYPNTAAAKEAKEALAHPAQNLPLFADRPVVLAKAAESAPKVVAPKEEPPRPVVEASAPEAPKGASGEVGLVYPVNPAEPARNAAATAPAVTATPEPPVHVGRPLPPGFRSRPGSGVHASGWALEIVGDRDGAPMVLVPGGEFLMGQDAGDPAEEPAHLVRLSTYYIDQHEVTVHQFNLFEKEIGRRTDRVRALAHDRTVLPSGDDKPVVMVAAKEAKDYATWAGKRLPTEAQWEMAARGTDGRLYPWGPNPIDGKSKRQPRQIDPVMTFAEDVSPYGAYDMGGNAWEWTKDWYDPRYYFYAVKNQIVDEPTGPTLVPKTRQLTVRGASKTGSAIHREPLKFEQRLPFLGFRCVLPVEGPDNAFQPKAKKTPADGGTTPQPGSSDAPPPF